MTSLLLAFGLGLSAHAHKPFFSGDYGTPEDAWEVPDPDISIVLYQEITCELPQLWMTLDGEADFPLYIQLGVPVIDRLSDYRPSVALVGPGLPAADSELPFELPDGTGVLVFDSDDVDQPGGFYEPFTQTESWIMVEETVVLPESGQAWLVAWDPGGQTGKLWVATGTVEDFSDVETADFIEWSVLVKDFHEVDPVVQANAPPERVCDSAETPIDEPEASGDKAAAGGCSTAGAAGMSLWGLALWACAAVWRRQEG
ncbi:MAG: hypothetical protein CMJ34_13420 [Phycisphaerae bacterium]|nr:hypothetical protein [Phycisphaerae bacterium]